MNLRVNKKKFIVLLVVFAAMVLALFLIYPSIINKSNKEKNIIFATGCLEAQGKIFINGYACYDKSDHSLRFRAERRTGKEDIVQVKVVYSFEETSKEFILDSPPKEEEIREMKIDNFTYYNNSGIQIAPVIKIGNVTITCDLLEPVPVRICNLD